MVSLRLGLQILSLSFILVPHALSALCTQPSIRREWSSLSETERVQWIDAVKCLTRLPHDEALSPSVDPSLAEIQPVNPESSYYDDFVYVHMDLNIKIHGTGQFLPWHRAYVQAFESSLRHKCNYTGAHPYWDWSIHAHDFLNDPIFSPSTTSGFGGNGNPDDDYQITDGAFASDFVVMYPAPNNIRRNFTLLPWREFTGPKSIINHDRLANTTFDMQEVNKLVSGFVGDFVGFQSYLEQGAHSGIHLIISGDMAGSCPKNAPEDCVRGPKWASNDPLFFMHHAMIDKIWYDWQHKDNKNFWAFRGGSVAHLMDASALEKWPNGSGPFLNLNSTIPSDGMFEEYTIYDMMDTTGEKLCYIYQ